MILQILPLIQKKLKPNLNLETAYLQFFYGYSEYNDEKLPLNPSLMIYFRKRLTPEILGEIIEMII